VEWIGSERHTPSLHRLRVYFPRETLLSYLPAVYQEEESSRDFMERYLSLFGTLFDSVDEEIDNMAVQFDRERVEGRQLRWLGSWLGLDSDDHWRDEKVRSLIRAAPELYRYRGTRRGIEKLVETFTGEPPLIVEPAQFKAMRDQADMRMLTDRLYSDNPFAFTVLLNHGQASSDKERVLLRSLIEEHKPAYTEVRLVWLQPWMYLDLQTYLGINTVLAEPSLFTLHADRSMPNDTLIVDQDMDGRMDAHTRLGMDSELE
jgi:phage tail-like protein